MADPVLLEVGRILKPHGLRGEVVVALVTNRPERLVAGATLQRAAGTMAELVVRHARPFEATGDGRWIVLFDGVSSREDAEALRGVLLQAPPLDDPDALWAHELIGAEVVAVSGELLGRVDAVEANPASDLLVLEAGGLIPLRFVVAREAGRLTVDIPPGLLDL
jgi:16S rRNA processing protein RimM